MPNRFDQLAVAEPDSAALCLCRDRLSTRCSAARWDGWEKLSPSPLCGCWFGIALSAATMPALPR